jgi:23S rRNA (uracil1939-C5)-methyltransferase
MEQAASPWPEELELDLTGIAQGGDAVGRYDNRAVFVAGALPGEHVRARLHDRQRAFARGTAIAIEQAAPERVPSFCPLERTCSAGDWRWIEYGAQLRFKAQILKDQLWHLGGIETDVVPPAAPDAPPFAYRTTAELHVEGARIGYYRPGSRHVASVPTCCLHHPLINQALESLRPLLSERTHLRGVTIRSSPSTGRTLAVLDAGKHGHALAQRWMAAEPTLAGVVDRHGAVLAGDPALEQIVADLHFRVGGASFFQINSQQWEPLVARVRDLLDPQPNARLLDLYCGVGLFALTLARDVGSVHGIESWHVAIEDAQHNATQNAITNAEFHSGNVEAVLPTLPHTFDGAVLDPPRRGCEPATLDALAAHAPARIVYVSCHPGTQARDCRRLVEHGYHVRSAALIDMFPHTSHVEGIVVLER